MRSGTQSTTRRVGLALPLLFALAGCGSQHDANRDPASLRSDPAPLSTVLRHLPAPTLPPVPRTLPHGIYFGRVVQVQDKADLALFRVTDPCGTPNTGTWAIPLGHATFSVNGSADLQGPTYDITRQQWEALPNLPSRSWRVQYSADTVWFDGGPNPRCQAG